MDISRRSALKGAAATSLASRLSFAVRRGPAIVMRNSEITKLGLGATAVADYFRRIDWAQAQSAMGESYDYPFRYVGDQAYNMMCPWNTPLGTGAVYSTSADTDHQVLQAFAAAGQAKVHSGDNNSQAWLVSKPGDSAVSLMKVTDTKTGVDNAGSAIPVYVPINFKPWGGTQHMCVIDIAQGIVWHGYQCQPDDAFGTFSLTNSTRAGGNIHFNLGRINDLYGNAVSPCTAPGIPSVRLNRYGWGDCTLRVSDVLNFYAGGSRVDSIKHVLRYKLSFNRMNGYLSTRPNDSGWQWPNVALDYCYNRSVEGPPDTGATGATCGTFGTSGAQAYSAGAQPGANSGGIDGGLFIALPPDVDIYAIRNLSTGKQLSPEGLALAWTMQNFGAAWRDSTGSTQIALNCDPAVGGGGTGGIGGTGAAYSSATKAFYDAISSDWPAIVAHLAIVRNYSTGSDGMYPYGGGGQFVCAPPPRLTSRG